MRFIALRTPIKRKKQRPHDYYCLEPGRPFVADLQILAYIIAGCVYRESTNVSTFSIYLAACGAFKAADTDIQDTEDITLKRTAARAPR